MHSRKRQCKEAQGPILKVANRLGDIRSPMTCALAQLLYGVTATDPITFVGISLLLVA